jgi:hypothetical protein
MPMLKIILLKKPTHKKVFAHPQNTLSFFCHPRKATPKKNERVFSPTLCSVHRLLKTFVDIICPLKNSLLPLDKISP